LEHFLTEEDTVELTFEQPTFREQLDSLLIQLQPHALNWDIEDMLASSSCRYPIPNHISLLISQSINITKINKPLANGRKEFS
jgi:hypothetical protein